MGIVIPGPPRELVLDLARRAGISIFVETGTFRGRTTRWASEHFRKVYTIELSQPHYDRHSGELRALGNVVPLQGDSRTVLADVLAQLGGEPVLFWLDSHWSNLESGTAGQAAECPLAQELEILAKRRDDIILIDDARCFLAAPSAPHQPSHWPTIVEVAKGLTSQINRFVQIFDDVIFAVPNRQELKEVLIEEARRWQQRIKPPPQAKSRLRTLLSRVKRALLPSKN
jgi:hypothetical protein